MSCLPELIPELHVISGILIPELLVERRVSSRSKGISAFYPSFGGVLSCFALARKQNHSNREHEPYIYFIYKPHISLGSQDLNPVY